MKVKMRGILILSVAALSVLIGAHSAYPCFNPTDLFAAEVVLNRSGMGYDLAPIRNARNVFSGEDVLVYRSHFEGRVAVILREVDDRPIIPLKGLSIRIQIPTRNENGELVEAVDLKRKEFDFKAAMKLELKWLSANGVIKGVTDEDVKGISEAIKAGTAGWNSRVVFDEGRWQPYYETKNPMLLRVKGGGCGGFALERMPEGMIALNVSSLSPKDKLATTWGRCKRAF
ncbi:hypothetical protein J7M22_13475 [Candidatus Poribacteria bacterium]|nr:hypothetical protein [Candidatus Poribacteria bacterium]